MTERSYRVTLRGRFGTLTDGQRSELLAQQHLHDMFAARQFANKGIAGRIVQTTLVSMDTIKVRQQGQTA